MNRDLIVTLDRDGRGISAWRIHDADGAEVAHGSTLAEMQNWRATNWRHVIGIVPGTDVNVRAVELPPASDTRALAALPFMLEDDLAAPLDEVHFALGPRQSGAKRVVAVVSKAKLNEWRNTLAAEGLEPTALVAEFQMLPISKDCGALRANNDLLSAALPDGSGFTLELGIAAPILRSLAASTNVSRFIAVSPLPNMFASASGDVTIDVETGRDGIGSLSQVPAGAINLLQGEFRPATRWSFGDIKWKLPVSLAACAALLALCQLLLSSWQDRNLADEAYRRANEVARSVLGSDVRLVNARAQVAAEAAGLRAQQDAPFVTYLDIFADTFSSIDGVSLDAIQFDGSTAAMSATVRTRSFDDLEALKERLSVQGYRIMIGESRQSGDTLLTDVSVSGP